MSFPMPSAGAHLPRRGLAALALVAGLAIAGCGSGADAASPAATGPVATSAPASAEAASDAPASGAAGDGCVGIGAAAIKEHVGSSDVAIIEIIGGCSMANITTTLATTDVEGGLAICEKAAEVAYEGDLNSISVVASDGRELAIGIDGASCIGEP